MPYDNMPESMWADMDKCVEEVQAKGESKEAAIKICYTSLMKAIDPSVLILQTDAPPTDDGNAFKAISETPEELRIRNYIVLFGGRDLTGQSIHGKQIKKANANGTKGEYFSANTDLESEYTKSGVLYVDFEHGEDPDQVGLDDDAILGVVDWKTKGIDEKGVFVDRVLNRRSKYVQWLEELVKAGLVGSSSMAVTGKTKKSVDGELLKWPLKRDSLTVMPFEPRMITENALAAVKSLAAEFPQMKSLLSVEPEAAVDSAAVNTVTSPVVISNPSQEKAKMEITEEALKAMALDVAKAAVVEYRKSEPAPKTPAVTIEKDEAEQPWKSAGEFLMAVKNSALYPTSEDRRLRPLKAATGLNEGTPADGGYLVYPEMATGIVERMYQTGQLLSRVTKDPIGPNSNGMIYNGIDETSRVDGSRYGGLTSYWLSEAGSKTASKPKFRQVELKLKKIAALCYSTDELLQDAVALQSWLERTVPNELMFRVEDAIYEGDGVGKPLGMLAAPALITVTRTDASKVTMTDVLTMWSRRWAGVQDYVWLINQDVFPQLALMAGTYQNVFLPQGSLAGVPYNTLLGKPIIEVEYAQSLNTKGDIMLAALSQYQTIDKGGIQAQSSIHVAFTTDETCFRFVYRIDGSPLWHSALTPLHGSNTQSPFVVLGSASA